MRNARQHQATLASHVWAVAACVGTALVATPLRHHLDLVNIVMLFLLTVFLVAVRLGREPAILAAFLSVALFDFFFVPPRLSFSVNDAQYLLTFGVMLVVALITGHLTAGLKAQAAIAQAREQRTQALYEMAKALSGALTVQQVIDISATFLRDVAMAESLLLLPDQQGELHAAAGGKVWFEIHLAAMLYGDATRNGKHRLRDQDGVCYCLLEGSTHAHGVLVIAPRQPDENQANDWQVPLMDAVTSLVAIAIERLHYVDVAQQAQVQVASERLRSSVLSALSHDLRTPLTILVGLADSLMLANPLLPEPQREKAAAIRDQSMRLCSLVENLLEMARLHAGKVELRKEWQPLEEVIGAAIKLLERSLGGHPVQVTLGDDLPLLEFDAVLLERVFCNLLENAAKYAPPGTAIEISAQAIAPFAEIHVRDHGPGIPQDRQEEIFNLFVRGSRESSQPGVGLGLAICRAIVEAHGGSIHAANLPQGGAEFVFTLPLGSPPAAPGEIEAAP